ncbi:MAG: S-layer homology domain-containing protein [Chloroflexota bacterium]|nr:S-layer homology domain-containing protein [Chloroflexota bacterium]MDQ5864372.1 S-layer homology domain-containing protein [Chloroflexota bacterium]
MLLASLSVAKAEARQTQLPSGSQSSPYLAAQLAAITGSGPVSAKSPAAESPGGAQGACTSTDDKYLVLRGSDASSSGAGDDIYGQWVTVDGTLLGSPFPISTAASNQYSASLAYNCNNDEYLVVWVDDRANDGENYNNNIYGQRVSGTGALLGGEFPISTQANEQRSPAVAYNSTNNEYLVVWHDLRPRKSIGGNDIYGQRVSSAGTLLGGEILVSTVVVAYRYPPAVAYNSIDNQYLVVWPDNRAPDCILCIYGQRVSGAGVLVAGEVLISSQGGSFLSFGLALAYNSTGNQYLVVWDDDREGPYSSDIYGQRVSGAGALLGGEISINIHESVQYSPAVAYNSTNNEYLVAWHDYRNDAPDIYGQRVSATGTLIGGDFPISTAASDQLVPEVAYNSTSNEYLVTWTDYRDYFCLDLIYVYGQMVSGAGALQGGNFNITPGETCTLKFADVPPSGEGSTFYTFIRFLTCRGIVSGYPCGGPGEACNAENDPYYRPGANVTRGQLSKIIANSAGLNGELPQGQQQFADVPPGSPFYEFVERLAETGAISGYPCGGAGEACDGQNRPYFRPNNPATRGQISKIVATAAGFDDEIPADQQTFTDVPPDSPFWVYIERLVAWEVLSGYNDASRCPTGAPCFRYNDNTTRGQMAKIAANAFFPGCQVP